MTHKMNLNSLRVFSVAARLGNFQRAAEDLNISHGAVSQRIKQLELDLGAPLFERKARGVVLTSEGAAYASAVQDALAIIATATTDLQRARGQVTFHLGSSFASKWLMPRMRDFRAQFPDISITTEIHDSVMERNLGQNEIAFWPGKEERSNPAHHVRRLCELHFVAVCSPNLLRPDWPMDVDTLLTLPLLQDAHRRWEKLMDCAGYSGTARLLNFDRSALALDAAIKGHGVAIAPTYMTQEDIRAGQLVEVWHNSSASGEHLYMAWAKQHIRSPHLMQTVNWVLAEFGLEMLS